GLLLQDMGRFDEAEVAYRRSLALDPSIEQRAQYNLGLACLCGGKLAEGWAHHELRFVRSDGAAKRSFPHPAWQGEPLAGKSLLIWGEQGIGDELLFASLFGETIERADSCVIECAAKLVPLFSRSFPGAQVVAASNPPHPATLQSFDFQSSAGGLARWLRPTLDSFPDRAGYLVPDPDRVAYWRERLDQLGPGLKVGFCWRSSLLAGTRKLHCTTIDLWGPIFAVPGIHFVNLQYDNCADELDDARRRFGVPLHVFPEVDLFNDLDEAAALTRALDLVVSAPTAASFLAAALGVPTWMMNYATAWQTLGTPHLPWFPSMRYYKRLWNQPWEEIIDRVAHDLRESQSSRGNR
ncbi:MAG TPA: glycosyltransferase, partial [Rhizobium sp.]|nr:glycosyltransferase [Rhizobium sp.]